MAKEGNALVSKTILIVSLCVLGLVAAVAGGYLLCDHLWAGATCSEESRIQLSAKMITDFEQGKALFCDLSEDERFAICPTYRLTEKFDDGGTITTYICSHTTAYAETRDLGTESRAKINEKLELFREVADIEAHCTTKRGVVYKIVQDAQEPTLY